MTSRIYPGDPTNYPATIPELDDSDTATAANFNAGGRSIADRSAWIRRAVYAGAVSCWQQALTPVAGNDVAWNGYTERWTVLETGSGKFTSFHDGSSGYGWNASYGATPATDTGVCLDVDPFTGTLCYFGKGSSANYITRVTQLDNPPAGVQTAQTALAALTAGAMKFVPLPGGAGGYWVFAGMTTTPTTYSGGVGAWSPDGSGVWTTFTLPMSFKSGTTAVRQLLSCVGPVGQMLVALCGKVPGTDASALMLVNVPSGGPPVATDVTPAVLGGSIIQIRGIAYDPSTGLYGMLGVLGSTPQYESALFTSPDLVTWTLAKHWVPTGSAGGFYAGGLACAGGVWAVLMRDSIRNDGSNRVFYSGDVVAGSSSSTWSGADYSDSTFVGPSVAAKLASSGAQLFKLGNMGGSGDYVMSKKAAYLAPSAAF